MKKIILILGLLMPLLAFSGPKKKKDLKLQLEQCDEYVVYLDSLIEVLSDANNCDIYIPMVEHPSNRFDAKMNRQDNKTERKRYKYKKKEISIEQKQKTKRNVFVQFRKLVSQNTWAMVVFGLACFFTGTPVGAVVRSIFQKKK